MVACPNCDCIADVAELTAVLGINETQVLLAVRCHCEFGYAALEMRDDALDSVVQDVMGVWFMEEMEIIDSVEKMQAVWARQERRAPNSVVREPSLS